MLLCEQRPLRTTKVCFGALPGQIAVWTSPKKWKIEFYKEEKEEYYVEEVFSFCFSAGD
jgi:hypothetical protein